MWEKVDSGVWSVFEGLTLSPSFYLPCNVLRVSQGLESECVEFRTLAAQFDSLEAWLLIPSFKTKVLEYFLTERPLLQDYLTYCKSLLQQNDVGSAVLLLEKTIKFKWPDTLRCLQN